MPQTGGTIRRRRRLGLSRQRSAISDGASTSRVNLEATDQLAEVAYSRRLRYDAKQHDPLLIGQNWRWSSRLIRPIRRWFLAFDRPSTRTLSLTSNAKQDSGRSMTRLAEGLETAFILAVFFTLGSLMASHPTQASPPEPVAFGGDLQRQFPDEASWQKARSELLSRLENFRALRLVPIESGAGLADRFDEVRFLRGRAGHMAQFAVVSFNLDNTDVVARQRREAATALEAQVEAGVGWIDATVIALGREKLERWIAGEPRLRRHGWRLNRILAEIGHEIPADAMDAIAALEWATYTPTFIRDAFAASDLGWPHVHGTDDADLAVDENRWSELQQSGDVTLRTQSDAAFLGKLVVLEEPLGLLLSRRYKSSSDVAHIRGYASPIDAYFDRFDGIPPGTVHRYVTAVHASRATAARWTRLVAQLQGTHDLTYGDLMQRRRINRAMTIEEAKDAVIASVAPFGPDFTKTLASRLNENYYDWWPRPHKSGLGLYWAVGDSDGHSLLFTTFNNNLSSAETLAEAANLEMLFDSIPSDKATERREEDYPVYGNAIWFMGQMLFDDYLLAHTTDKSERIALLYDDIWRLWDSYFRYGPTTELEEHIIAANDAGHPLSGKEMTSIYAGLLRELYASDGQTVRVEEYWGAEGLSYPQMYYGEVLPEWALAMTAAAAMANKVERGDRGTLFGITHPFTKEGSFTSYDQLRDININFATDGPFQAINARMNAKMDQLEALLTSRRSGR
jgi:oligoendopeptidase F